MNIIRSNLEVSVENKLTVVRWPFEKMKIGDSFLVPEGVRRGTVSIAMLRAEKTGKGMFVSRTIESRIRVWRFA